MKKILCIEDETGFLKEVVDILNNEGYEAVGVRSSEDGLQKIAEIQPDLVLCDVVMPGISGFDLLKTSRETLSPITQPAFIFLSARSQQKEMLSNFNLQADDYFVKPVDFSALLTKIRSKLAKNSSEFSPKELRNDGEKRHVIDHINHSFDNIQRLLSGLMAELAAHTEHRHYLRYADHIEEHAGRLRRHLEALIELSEEKNNPDSGAAGAGEESIKLHLLVNQLYSYLQSQNKLYLSPLRNQITEGFPAVLVDEKYFSVAVANILEQIMILATDHETIIVDALAASSDAAGGEGGILCRFTIATQHPQLFMAMNTQFSAEIMRLHGGGLILRRYEKGVHIALRLPAYRVEL